MKKLIDIPDERVKTLKVMAVMAGKDLKNWIQDTLIEMALAEESKQKKGKK